MDLTHDAILGGRVRLSQPAKGYRAGVDPVFLAAACPARPGETVLELGCGVGAAALCLAARVPDLTLTGVERVPQIADLARQNGAASDARLEVVTADLAALPTELRQRSFHQVIANPPYFDRGASVPSDDALREGALGVETPLETWVAVAARRLRPKGRFTMIHRPESLPTLLAAFAGRLGAIRLLPLVPREGRDARLILVQAQKDGRADMRLLSPIVIHRGARHERDGEDYSEVAKAILSDCAAIAALAD